MTINELALQVVDAMQSLGYSDYTAWGDYRDTFIPIIKFHAQRGKMDFDRDVMEEYARNLEGRVERGEICVGHYVKLKRGMRRLVQFHGDGKLQWNCLARGSKYKLNGYYEKILAEFLAHDEYSPNTRDDVTWVAKKYFAWLELEGHPDLSDVGATEIQHFMSHCGEHMRSSGIHDVKLYMKKLYRYLAENGRSAHSYKELLSFHVSRESKMLPAAPQAEIAAVLDVIDRRIPKGKRDYAIILLGAVTGLRASDITRLRLPDIDWKNGEIKIVQAKTGKSLALPLTKDVGEAIQDYILHGRQQTASDAVFLRQHAPFQAFADAVAVGDIYDDYRKKAGLPRDAFDGRGFHSLRRSVGTNMVTSGIPVTAVAQILGHSNVDSTKKYISLDSAHLKECALDFTGIEGAEK